MKMNHWASLAERLRTVRQAHDDYLVRDAVERLIIGPMLLDRLADDLCGYGTIDSAVQDMTPPADQ